MLRIGLLADTQLTSPKATSSYLFRTSFADLVANVAVRTTAQEMLAAEHLGYLGADVAARRPDVLLYLGDGANSGCDDELEPFFAQLDEIRRKAERPVFFVVGNHDYLATGNQAAPSQRALACAQGGYATKAEIVERAAMFNRASWQQFASKDARFVRYADSLEHVNAKPSNGCRSDEESQQQRGCYYAGVVELQAGDRKLQLVLADTSDYYAVVLQPQLRGIDVAQFAGVRGAIGFGEGSQNEWLASAMGKGADVATRIFASHYPTADLSWNLFGARLMAGRPGDLMLPSGYNLWLSGHTHEPKPERLLGLGNFSDGGLPQPRYYDEINVGSTTDYRMHGAIVDVGSHSALKQAVPAMDKQAVDDCGVRIDAIVLPDTVQRPYPGWGGAPLRLGLTKHYRRDHYDQGIARRNLQAFLAEPARAADRERWVRCLMYAGAQAEHGWDWWMF